MREIRYSWRLKYFSGFFFIVMAFRCNRHTYVNALKFTPWSIARKTIKFVRFDDGRVAHALESSSSDKFMVFAINKIVLISMYAILFRHKKCTLVLFSSFTHFDFDLLRCAWRTTANEGKERKCDCIRTFCGIRFIGNRFDCMRDSKSNAKSKSCALNIQHTKRVVWCMWPMGY